MKNEDENSGYFNSSSLGNCILKSCIWE